MTRNQVIQRALATGVFALTTLFPLSAQAELIITGKRVVYNAPRKSVDVEIHNPSDHLVAAQAWVGDAKNADPNKSAPVPFIVASPLLAVKPNQSQTIRIVYTGSPALPTDKESLFWLNVLEIPPEDDASASHSNMLNLSIQSVIKLLYRPASLKGDSIEAAKKLTWHLTQTPQSALQVSNPTNYVVTLQPVTVSAGNQKATTTDSAVIAPGETQLMPLNKATHMAPNASVQYQAVDDFSAPHNGNAPLQAGSLTPPQ